MNSQDMTALWYAIHQRKGEIDPLSPRANSTRPEFIARMEALVVTGDLYRYGGMYYVTEQGKAEVTKHRGAPLPPGAPHPIPSSSFRTMGVTWVKWRSGTDKPLLDRDRRAVIMPAGPVFHLRFDGEWVRMPTTDHRRTFKTQRHAMEWAAALIHAKPLVRTQRTGRP